MLGAAPYGQRRRPIGPYRTKSPLDIAWRVTWPYFITTILATMMILCTLLIGALEIASLSKSTSTALYGNTSSTGAGIWCSLFFSIACILILLINYMPHVRLWATIAFIASIIAVCFGIILIGLDSKAIQDGRAYNSLPVKTQILCAQLAFAIVELLLCFVYIGIYIMVVILAPSRIRRTPRVLVR
ncbi:unnamed protein product [Adineta steineri]|uniref:Uncharacterized protein n=1 Tax=Adineta steineri TaxID=433720 RepID=A0A815Z1Q3_9BILA|nr:unnamed protein product [Adineta steineri]CAF1578830.1 unnamed protein product [Adineta steineri]